MSENKKNSNEETFEREENENEDFSKSFDEIDEEDHPGNDINLTEE